MEVKVKNILAVGGSKADVLAFDEKFKGKAAKWHINKIYAAKLKSEEKTKALQSYEEEYAKLPPAYCLNALHPIPEDVIEGLDETIREWCNNSWGPSSDMLDFHEAREANDTDQCYGEFGMMYAFDTANSPAYRWIESISEDFPTLRFSLKYTEEGFERAGEFEFVPAVITFIQEYQWSDLPYVDQPWLYVKDFRQFILSNFKADPLDVEMRDI